MAGQIKKITVAGQTYDIGGGVSAPIDTTYAALKSLKDSKSLTAGQKYRITDFVSMFASKYQSGNHPFDIIVEAISDSLFSEQASAVNHSGDSYFADSNLAAWIIYYCFDNDTTRFEYASSTGKGFIYYLKDEFGNEAPYDFKNIKFPLSSQEFDFVTSGTIYAYPFSTFSTQDTILDASLNKDYVSVLGNIIKDEVVACFIVKKPSSILKTSIRGNVIEKGGNRRVIYSDFTSLASIDNNSILGICYIKSRNFLDNNHINAITNSKFACSSTCKIKNSNIILNGSEVSLSSTNVESSDIRFGVQDCSLTSCTLMNTNLIATNSGSPSVSNISSQDFSNKNVKISSDGSYKAVDPFA